MEFQGQQFIKGMRSAGSGVSLYSYDAAHGGQLPYRFWQATEAEISAAADAAAAAFPLYRTMGLEERARFLETIAAGIDALDDSFVKTVMLETGLPEPRVRAERLRTGNQLRLFASVVRRGDFIGGRIDTALPDRQPLPRPDIRQQRIALGPVAVFGASNFPLAFSVAGGDTASALAAGCPVVVKAHSGHLRTSELVAETIVRAAERCAMPSGVFGMLFGDTVGAPLVIHPAIKAVGFTGSLGGGKALRDLAAGRPEPIPVFAEMSSINPVIVMPGALEERAGAIAAGLANSVTLGSGQFCTNPGLVIGVAGAAFDSFCSRLADEIKSRPPSVMLNRSILDRYNAGVSRHAGIAGVELLAGGPGEADRAAACLFKADAALLFDSAHPLEEELFGPATVVAAVRDREELIQLLQVIHGQLSASLFANSDDLAESGPLIEVLETRVGRIVLNDYPTGLEVCDATVHGGPWPATSDSRGTSVGSLAIDRFLRPVCYQGCPEALLPPALKDGNPLGLRRLVNGEWSTGKISG